jgi:hypothetical protein
VLVNYLLLPATTGQSAIGQAAFRKAARLSRGTRMRNCRRLHAPDPACQP